MDLFHKSRNYYRKKNENKKPVQSPVSFSLPLPLEAVTKEYTHLRRLFPVILQPVHLISKLTPAQTQLPSFPSGTTEPLLILLHHFCFLHSVPYRTVERSTKTTLHFLSFRGFPLLWGPTHLPDLFSKVPPTSALA